MIQIKLVDRAGYLARHTGGENSRKRQGEYNDPKNSGKHADRDLEYGVSCAGNADNGSVGAKQCVVMGLLGERVGIMGALSEIWSDTLSGCPSDTDSDVNK